mgnify:CR=1 FL=1
MFVSNGTWKSLGWKHTMWELVRYYCSIRGSNNQKYWLDELCTNNQLRLPSNEIYPVGKDVVAYFDEYIIYRNKQTKIALSALRTEEESLLYCKQKGIKSGTTRTKSTDHHQSSKSIVATVGFIANNIANNKGISIDKNPQSRCIWCKSNNLHVTARNLDGAIPGLSNPSIVWEIKEYWGKTKGGSKMSDAVYECNLVGRELREFEENANVSVTHVVFVDGKEQWGVRVSDLTRFIDLTNQGLIDYLFVGKQIENELEIFLDGIVKK